MFPIGFVEGCLCSISVLLDTLLTSFPSTGRGLGCRVKPPTKFFSQEFCFYVSPATPYFYGGLAYEGCCVLSCV